MWLWVSTPVLAPLFQTCCSRDCSYLVLPSADVGCLPRQGVERCWPLFIQTISVTSPCYFVLLFLWQLFLLLSRVTFLAVGHRHTHALWLVLVLASFSLFLLSGRLLFSFFGHLAHYGSFLWLQVSLSNFQYLSQTLTCILIGSEALMGIP